MKRRFENVLNDRIYTKKKKKKTLPKAVQKNARWNSVAGGSKFSTETNVKYVASFINPQICKICCASE